MAESAIRPDDRDALDLKRILENKIAALEAEQIIVPEPSQAD